MSGSALIRVPVSSPASGVDPRSAPLVACAEELACLPDAAAVRGLVGGWLLEHRTSNTRNAYARDLGAFARWLSDRGLDLLGADRVAVATYAEYLTVALDRRPSTVRRHLGSICSFYRYALQAGAIGTNPAVDVRRPKGEPVLTPALSLDEAGRLLDAASRGTTQDRLLLALLLGAGLRVSEAVSLDAADIETVRGHVTAVVRGKGGREDRITLSDLAACAIDELRRERDDGGPLLRNRSGRRMTADGATAALARLSRAAGLEQVRPHTLRATAITIALENDVSLRDVQDFSRHADPRTTRRYDRAARGLDRHAVTTDAILGAVAAATPPCTGTGRPG